MPWVLGKVCSYWRTLALSFPELWSEIHLNLELEPLGERKPTCTNGDESDTEGVSHIIEEKHNLKPARRSSPVQELLQACLSRSGNELLTFSISTSGIGRMHGIKPIITSLVQHAERWADVDFCTDVLFAFYKQLAPVENRLFNLRRLAIEYLSLESLFFSPPLVGFENPPKLRELKMADVVQPFHALRVPWSQITSLVSKWCTFSEDEFSQIMTLAVNLVSLTVESGSLIPNSEPVLLPHLENLIIKNKGGYISKIFQSVNIPNLKKLAIHALTPFHAHQAIQMLNRSQCKPTQLTISSSFNADVLSEENNGIVRLLSELPSLTSLHLTVLRSTDAIIPALQFRRQPGSSLLLPNLQTIAVNDPLCSSVQKMVEALSSRIKDYDNAKWGPWPKDQVGLKCITLSLSRVRLPNRELDSFGEMAGKRGVEIKVLPQ